MARVDARLLMDASACQHARDARAAHGNKAFEAALDIECCILSKTAAAAKRVLKWRLEEAKVATAIAWDLAHRRTSKKRPGGPLQVVPESCRDKSLATLALGVRGDALEHVPTIIEIDMDMAKAAVSADGFALELLPTDSP